MESFSHIQSVFAAQRAAHAGDRHPTAGVRLDRLRRVEAMTIAHQEEIVAAISADFGHRSRHETLAAEILLVIAAARHARRHLRSWIRPQRVRTAWQFLPGSSRIHRTSLGVVGVISPWNYPYQLAMAPALAAIAAGNRTMIKSSELTPRLSMALADMVARHFSPEEVAVVTGGADVGRAFAALPFDHLLFTGSASVGREVAASAAKNLTPVTLELGGKSPVILSRGCDLDTAARRIIAGKLFNAGQTCIAPDYVLAHPEQVAPLADALVAAVRSMYPGLVDNPDYTAIIDQRHLSRLRALLDDARERRGRVLPINPADELIPQASRKFPPALVLDADDGMRVMNEEIFGPVLPVRAVSGVQEALSYVMARPRPLALYWFGDDRAERDRVIRETAVGGITVNDTMLHFCQENLPFGGVGESGFGAYHGERGFRTFSKETGVFYQSTISATGVMHPPYGKRFDAIIDLLRRWV